MQRVLRRRRGGVCSKVVGRLQRQQQSSLDVLVQMLGEIKGQGQAQQAAGVESRSLRVPELL